jgi:hypothetical protein
MVDGRKKSLMPYQDPRNGFGPFKYTQSQSDGTIAAWLINIVRLLWQRCSGRLVCGMELSWDGGGFGLAWNQPLILGPPTFGAPYD